MGLVDILEKTDKKIWEQYEKVTNYCNKEYGWNKYDLARLSNSADYGSYFGAGIYLAVEGFNGNTSSLVIGSLTIPLAMLLHRQNKKRLDFDEKYEKKLLERTGAAKPVVYKPWRPFIFGLVAWGAYHAYSYFTGGEQMQEGLSISQEEFNLLSGMTMALFASSFFSKTSGSYFKDQIMTPHKKKKGFFKTMYDKARGKVEVPQLEPVPEQKYQSLEDLAA